MIDSKCPFSAPLVSEQFHCRLANQVVRRGGAEIACRSETACQRCDACFAQLKQPVLAELGLEDDLTSVPHSVLLKIQFAGLLCLQQRLGINVVVDQIEDIDSLLQQAEAHYGRIEDFPYPEMVPFITAYKLKRRHAR